MNRARARLKRCCDNARAIGIAIFTISCDGPCCRSVFEGTNTERKRAGWTRSWRRRPGTGIADQIDLCPTCRGAASSPPKDARRRGVRFELVKEGETET